MNYALSKKTISTPSYINLSLQTKILALYPCLWQTRAPWARFGCTYTFSVELHWEHGFSPILQFPKTSRGLGKVGAEDAKREVGSRSEEQFPVARLCWLSSGRAAGRGDMGLGSPPGRDGLKGGTAFSAGTSSHSSITLSVPSLPSLSCLGHCPLLLGSLRSVPNQTVLWF